MSFMSDQDRERIRAAIAAAEQRTRGELVTVVATAADDYHFIPTLWAALLALAAGPLARAAGLGTGLAPGLWDLLQLLAFAGLAGLFLLTPLRFRLVPRAVRAARASRLAHEQFVRQGVHLTEGHTGILLFVAVAERYVEIIADRGIAATTDPARWQPIVDGFTAQVRQGRVADGFVQAVQALGDILAERAPALPGEDNPNELSDLLVEI